MAKKMFCKAATTAGTSNNSTQMLKPSIPGLAETRIPQNPRHIAIHVTQLVCSPIQNRAKSVDQIGEDMITVDASST